VDDGTIDAAARDLAALMRPYPWYHRMVANWARGRGSFLVVYGDGDRPPEVPAAFRGYPVDFVPVTAARPCPFGSVQPEAGGGREE
jgi:hypothetical protein